MLNRWVYKNLKYKKGNFLWSLNWYNKTYIAVSFNGADLDVFCVWLIIWKRGLMRHHYWQLLQCWLVIWFRGSWSELPTMSIHWSLLPPYSRREWTEPICKILAEEVNHPSWIYNRYLNYRSARVPTTRFFL